MRSSTLVTTLAFLVVPALAAADPASTALFNEGMKALDAHDYATACPKLEESQRLEPAIGTSYNLGECYAASGRPASAWAAFNRAADMAAAVGQGNRAAAARARADQIAPSLARLVIVVEREVDGMVVTRSGVPIGKPQWGVAVPVDPGTYSVRATAPGKRTFEVPISVQGAGVQQKVTIPTLADEPNAEPTPTPVPVPVPPPASPTTNGEPPPPPPPPAEEEAKPAPWGWQRTAAVVSAGVGLVGVGVGIGFGLRSFGKHSDASAHCDARACDAIGYDANSAAITAGNVSTVAFVVGGVALAAGATFWIIAPSSSPSSASVRVAPMVGAGSTGLSAAGRF